MKNNALFWLVSINKGIFFKKQVLSQNFPFFGWISIKLARIINRKGFKVKDEFFIYILWITKRYSQNKKNLKEHAHTGLIS